MTTSIKYSVHQCCDVKEYLGVNKPTETLVHTYALALACQVASCS